MEQPETTTNTVRATVDLDSNVAVATAQAAKKFTAAVTEELTGRTISHPASLDLPAPAPRRYSRAVGRRQQTQPAEDLAAAFRVFRVLCDQLCDELKKIDDYLVEGKVADEGLEVVVEIENLLEKLYDCRWGKGTVNAD